jgi:hypothetical protein
MLMLFTCEHCGKRITGTDILSLFVRPFKDGPIHGLMFLLPPYGIYDIASRWNEFQPTFRRLLTSCISIVLVLLAYMFIPTVDPEHQSARTISEEARRLQQDLVKDAREVGREIRQEARTLEDRVLPRLEAER